MRQGSPKIGPWTLDYENKVQKVYRVSAEFKDFSKEFFVSDTGERTAMLAVNDGSALLVRQYRLMLNGLSWEIPGGKVDEGETPAQAAVRECLEETGSLCRKPRLLISYHLGLDVTHNPTHVFVSEDVAVDYDLTGIHTQEVSGNSWVPLSRCARMISSGKIVDCLTMLALLSYMNLPPVGNPPRKVRRVERRFA
jgi:ADP-ribose pyrophosphatase